MIDRIRLLGRNGLDVLGAIGRSGLFIFQSLWALPNPRTNFPLVVKQIYFIGVLSLVIIVVSGLIIGMVLALQGYNILNRFGSEQ
ncbi:MAG TPA: ABC transporter permease, partial [Dongiaceae bacterium]|nr:ABC transporter permease [Dongiaceae bacterium]